MHVFCDAASLMCLLGATSSTALFCLMGTRKYRQRCLVRTLRGSAVVSARYFDFERLREVAHTATRNLNRIIDINYYPVAAAERSNLNHRPIGIGVQVRRGHCPTTSIFSPAVLAAPMRLPCHVLARPLL